MTMNGSILPVGIKTQEIKTKEAGTQVDDINKIKQAAESFEAYFIYMLLKEMRKSVPEGGLMGGGPGKDVYQYLFDEAISKEMSKSGGIGLSKMLIENYQKSQQSGVNSLPTTTQGFSQSGRQEGSYSHVPSTDRESKK